MAGRAAIYARFSSDLQRDRSIDDQVALCRSYAERAGYDVVARFEDRASSGASLLGRDGLLTLMERARDPAHPFDVVVVEALDRLSRDQEDLAGLYKRLSFAGVEILAVHDGRADQVQIGIRGLVGALYLQDLAHKVRRGMAGVVRDGRSAGGRAYGYQPVPGRPGELAIVEEEAAVVRRIFGEYLAGRSPREIAGDLNRDGVPPPRGGYWAGSAINGNTHRGHGIIQNPLYGGRLVWNRVRMIKDPDTGRRVSRVNEPGARQVADVPHLAIVEPATFAAAVARKASRSYANPRDVRKPRHLLSGLLRCGCCGAGMSVKDRDCGRVRVLCTRAKESRSCDNRRPYYLDAIERTVVGGMRIRLANPAAIELYIRTYNEERQRLAGDTVRNRARLERQLDRVRGEIARATDLLIKGVIDEGPGRERMTDLRRQRAGLEEELSAIARPPTIVTLHPRAVDTYMANLARLEMAIREGMAVGGEAATALRDIVDTVVVHPGGDGPVTVEVTGPLSHLVGPDGFPNGTFRGGRLVAGDRYSLSPPTITFRASVA